MSESSVSTVRFASYLNPPDPRNEFLKYLKEIHSIHYTAIESLADGERMGDCLAHHEGGTAVIFISYTGPEAEYFLCINLLSYNFIKYNRIVTLRVRGI